ncbi:MAG: DNA recombination protein RmuC [Flavobacteriales bacterium]
MEYLFLFVLVLFLVLLLRTQWQLKELNQKVKAGGEDRIRAAVEEVIRELLRTEFRASREELSAGLRGNRKELADSLTGFRKEMTEGQQALVKATEEKLEKVRLTVDEKLHRTLEERLGESFKLVSERLEAVQKGLGEMKSLASGVGDLKKVLTNVKTRGVLGEIALGQLLDQVLAPEQYERNVRTRPHAANHVEFALRLPGPDDDPDRPVYLPIDAKFPQEDYIRLQAAYEMADPAEVERCTRALVTQVKRFAKDIRERYVEPPYTTDFAILFLPVEGLYAEVIRQPDLVAQLQREYKIVLTGPTTLAAMLNSLQMGFQTLAIQRRSSEVWQVLSAVKKEFGKFGGVLEKAQKKLTEANQELDTLLQTRTRVMLRKLRAVESLPEAENSDSGGES